MSKDIISYKYYGYLVKFVKKGLDFRNIYIFAKDYNLNMSKLKEKSEFNIDAAKLLISRQYYASSVHCSYYSCFQLLKYTINYFSDVDYETLSKNISASRRGTHQYVIDFVANELNSHLGIRESRNFKRSINDLKQFRTESDYDNIEIGIEKGTSAFEKANEIRTYVKTNFNV